MSLEPKKKIRSEFATNFMRELIGLSVVAAGLCIVWGILWIPWHFHQKHKEEIFNSPAETQKRAENGLKNDARWKCEQTIKSNAKFPDKADFTMFDWNEEVYGFMITVTGSGSFMNGLGLMVPHKFVCKFEQIGPQEIKMVRYDFQPG